MSPLGERQCLLSLECKSSTNLWNKHVSSTLNCLFRLMCIDIRLIISGAAKDRALLCVCPPLRREKWDTPAALQTLRSYAASFFTPCQTPRCPALMVQQPPLNPSSTGTLERIQTKRPPYFTRCLLSLTHDVSGTATNRGLTMWCNSNKGHWDEFAPLLHVKQMYHEKERSNPSKTFFARIRQEGLLCTFCHSKGFAYACIWLLGHISILIFCYFSRCMNASQGHKHLCGGFTLIVKGLTKQLSPINPLHHSFEILTLNRKTTNQMTTTSMVALHTNPYAHVNPLLVMWTKPKTSQIQEESV